MSKVKIDGVAQAVMYELDKYTNDVRDAIKESAERIATEGKTKLQLQTQPSSTDMGSADLSNRRLWKTYAKGWQVKINSGKNFANCIIHQNQKNGNYRLTHLLEYGHLTRNGTRTRAFAHIKPVEEYVVKQFQKEVEQIIKRGGK